MKKPTPTLSKAATVEAIHTIEAMRGPRRFGRFYQNKRSDYRDLKWDYLDPAMAGRISRKLTKLGIRHKLNHCTGRWGGSEWSQVRLCAKRDFSLKYASRCKHQATPETPRQRWKRNLAKLRATVNALTFGKRHHSEALHSMLRAAEQWGV